MDALWGYKNDVFIDSGWFSARMDDLLAWPTAKVTSLLYAFQGHFFGAIKNGYIQGRQYKSLNGGWAIATGATVLNIQLGGPSIYHGKTVHSITLGAGNIVAVSDISKSLALVKRSALIFLFCYFVIVYQAQDKYLSRKRQSFKTSPAGRPVEALLSSADIPLLR